MGLQLNLTDKMEEKETTWTESDYELNQYLNGDGDVVHLYNYYNIINNLKF